MKALLTGANGFLGKHLVNKLNLEGCEVYSLGRVKAENANFFHLESLEDKKTIERCLLDINPNYLFHLAGTVSNDGDGSKKVNTDFAETLPVCLSPILTLGVKKYGASIIPLEELPSTILQCFRAE